MTIDNIETIFVRHKTINFKKTFVETWYFICETYVLFSNILNRFWDWSTFNIITMDILIKIKISTLLSSPEVFKDKHLNDLRYSWIY